MNANNPIDTIKALAEKLLALSDPARGGAPGEIEAARRKLAALLKRHGLTEADLVSSRVEWRKWNVFTEAETELLANVFFFIRQVNKCTWRKYRETALVPGKRLRPVVRRTFAVEFQVTPTEYADITDCFNHYAPELRRTVLRLKQEVAAAKKALKFAPTALAAKHDLNGPATDAPQKPMSQEDHDALLRAYLGVRGERWSKPVEPVARLA